MSAEPVNRLWDHPSFRATALFREFQARPLGFIDVGARGGAHPVVAPVASGTAILGFEPDPDAFEALTRLPPSPWARLDFERTGLAEAKGVGALHVMRAETNTSLRNTDATFTARYAMPKWERVRQLEVALDTLDSTLKSPRRAAETWWGEFIKLDTQGTEYEVLQGARATLAERTLAAIVEVEFFPIYAGQKLFSEIETFLRALGFSFYGFGSMMYRSRKTVPAGTAQRERPFWADAYFFRDPFDPPARRLTERQAAVTCVAALLLGFFDFALEVAGRYFSADVSSLETIAREPPFDFDRRADRV